MKRRWIVRTGFLEIEVEALGWLEAFATGMPELGLDLGPLARLKCKSRLDGGATVRDPVTDIEIEIEPVTKSAEPAFQPQSSFSDEMFDAPEPVAFKRDMHPVVSQDDSLLPPSPVMRTPMRMVPAVTLDPGAADAPSPRLPVFPASSPTILPPPDLDLGVDPPAPRWTPPPARAVSPPPPPPPRAAPVPAAPLPPPPRVEPSTPRPAAAPPPVAPPPRVAPAPQVAPPPRVASAPQVAPPPPVDAPPAVPAPVGASGERALTDDEVEDLFLELGDITLAGGIAAASGAALTIVLRHVVAGAGAVLIRTSSGEGLRFRAVSGPAANDLVDTVIPLDRGLAGTCVQLGIGLCVGDVQRDKRHDDRVARSTGYATHELLAVPVRADNGGVFGCLELLNPPDPFTDRDFEIAARVAASLGAFLNSVYATR